MKPYKVYNTYNDFIVDVRSISPIKIYKGDLIKEIKKEIPIDKLIPLLITNRIEAINTLDLLIKYGFITFEDLVSELQTEDLRVDIDFECDKKILVNINKRNDNSESSEDNVKSYDNEVKNDNVNDKDNDNKRDIDLSNINVFDDDEEW